MILPDLFFFFDFGLPCISLLVDLRLRLRLRPRLRLCLRCLLAAACRCAAAAAVLCLSLYSSPRLPAACCHSLPIAATRKQAICNLRVVFSGLPSSPSPLFFCATCPSSTLHRLRYRPTSISFREAKFSTSISSCFPATFQLSRSSRLRHVLAPVAIGSRFLFSIFILPSVLSSKPWLSPFQRLSTTASGLLASLLISQSRSGFASSQRPLSDLHPNDVDV